MTTRMTKATLQAQLDAAEAKLAKLEAKKAKKATKAKWVPLNLTCPQCGREGYKTENGLADHLERGWCAKKAAKTTTKAKAPASKDTPSGTKAPYPTPEQWLEWAKAKKAAPKATTKLQEAAQDVTQALDTKDAIPVTGNADPVMAPDGGITAQQLDLASLQEAAQGTWGDDAILQFKATQHDAKHARQLIDEAWHMMDLVAQSHKALKGVVNEFVRPRLEGNTERIQALEAKTEHIAAADVA